MQPCVVAGGDTMMPTLEQLADAQLMCVYFAKLAAHNGQRSLARRLVAIAVEIDWQMYMASQDQV